ncbi:MAG: hypothetical protein GXP33_05815 [Spirochaetes bacterium]|nr:hypothetical protein [Spirochaetota bacterium]
MKRLIIIILVLLFYIPALYAQYVPGIKWREITTPHFNIIFPAELNTEAERAANLMEHIYIPIGKTLDSSPGKFPLLLTNTGITPNAYVQLAPKLSEWYHRPPEGYLLGSGEWYSLLATHETRHMVQFTKIDRGFNRVVHILYGGIGELAMEAFSIPGWFLEGDAVTTETALTNSGRGRMPVFTRDIRTLLLSGKKFSYYKAALGRNTYKDYYPGRYNLGYLLVAYLRDTDDARIWSRILNRTSNLSFIPLMFNIAVRKETGKSLSGLYNETMSYLKNEWEKQLKSINITEAVKINKTRKYGWTNYNYPFPLKDGSIIALKWGMDDAEKLVQILPDGTEKQIMPISPIDGHISERKGMVIWSQSYPDPVWQSRAWADIVILNLKSRRKIRITNRGHFFVPSLSPDGKLIAAVEFTPERKCSLVIFDIAKRKEIFRFPAGADELFGSPAWTEDGSRIVLTRQGLNGKSLSLIDISASSIRDIIPRSWNDIENPRVFKNLVFFSSSYSGIDNIYALNIKTNNIYRVSSRKFGAYQPQIFISGGKPVLIYSDYSPDGSNIVKAQVTPEQWINIKQLKQFKPLFVNKITGQEQGGSIVGSNDIPDKVYPVKDYSPLLHSINIHSWGIIPESTESIGFFIMSNDILNTLKLTPSISYNFIENTFGADLTAIYSGTFPGISLSSYIRGRHTRGEGEPERTYLQESGSLALLFPLDFSEPPVTSGLFTSIGISYSAVSGWNSTYPQEIPPPPIFPLTADLKYYSFIKQAHRDILPRLGTENSISITGTPFEGNQTYQIFLNSKVYLPGLLRHDSLKLSIAYLDNTSGSYTLINPFIDYNTIIIHGYPAADYSNFVKASSEYTFPVFYPDLALGPFLYISRLKGKLFYDAGINLNDYDFNLLQSAGMELIMEFMPLTLPLPLNIGVRFIYRITDNNFRIEDTVFSLGIDF